MGQKLAKNTKQKEKNLPQTPHHVCCICLEESDTSQDKKFILNEECQHTFCHDCGKQWIQSEIDLFSTGDVRCPSHNDCGMKLNLMNLKILLTNEEYEKLVNRQVEHLLMTDPSFHRCSGGNCLSLYQYDDQDPSYCQDFYEIGDRIFFFGKSSYQMIPGTVIGKRGEKYDVQDCPKDDKLPVSYFMSASQMKPVHKVLRIGTEVEYGTGTPSFFNRPKSYIITAINSTAAAPDLYDLVPTFSTRDTQPMLGVSYQHLGLNKSQYLHSQHRHRCPQCNTIVCMRCNVLHPLDVSCEDHAQREARDAQNILQMAKFRQEYLQDLQSVSLASSSPLPMPSSSVSEEEKELMATLTLLNELEVRICKRCHNGVCKSSGCDKLMCRCGYKFCYHCGVENAVCQCTPSNHYYIDNVGGGATP
jgi:hypothetical protein